MQNNTKDLLWQAMVLELSAWVLYRASIHHKHFEGGKGSITGNIGLVDFVFDGNLTWDCHHFVPDILLELIMDSTIQPIKAHLVISKTQHMHGYLVSRGV